MRIRIDILEYLQRLVCETPLNLPQRAKFLISQVNDYCKKFQDECNYVSIEVNSCCLNFDHRDEDIILTLINQMPRTYFPSDRQLFGLRVLFPEETFCCRGFRIDPRASSVKIFDINGITTGVNYHGVCKECKTIYYHNYVESGNVRRFKCHPGQDLFSLTSCVAVSKRLMTRFELQASISFTSFEKMAAIYNEENNSREINAQLIEEHYFIYKITQIKSEMQWHRKKNSHIDIEKICEEAYTEIKSAVDIKWMEHRCADIGCRERIVVCDGNEKLFRYICAKEIEHVSGGTGQLNTRQRCTRNPLRGNQSVASSKYCPEHAECLTSTINERIDLHPMTRGNARKLHEVFVSEEGCKLEANLDKYSERTAGMFYLFRTCGIRLSHVEMFTAESLTTVFSTLIDTFGECPDTNSVRTIIYDRSCDLHPFLARLAREGNEVARRYSVLDFIVDIFHAEKHTMPKCVIGTPECTYHPDLPQFTHIRRANTEICEQSFHLLNQCKHITRNMTYAKRLCFLKFIDNDFNTRLEKTLQ